MSGLTLHGVYKVPVPLHLDLDNCLNGCKYCFAEKGDRVGATIKSIEKAINIQDEVGLRNYYIKNRYPVCVSNNSDILNCKNRRKYWDIVKILKQVKFPLYIETKGVHKDEDLEFFDYLDSGDHVYLTISHFGNNKYEPLAPSFENRIKTLEYCLKRGLNVTIGFNPIIAEVFDYQAAYDFVKKYEKKVFGYVIIEVTAVSGKRTNYKNALTISGNNDNLKNYENLLPLYKFLIEKNIPASVRWGTGNLFGFSDVDVATRNVMKQGVLIAWDFVLAAQAAYEVAKEDAQAEGKELDAPVGLDFEGFAELIDIPDIIMKRSEVRCFSYFKLRAFPERFKYKDYLKVAFSDDDFQSPYQFTGLSYDKENNLYFYPSDELFENPDRIYVVK